jgi:peptide/nickel transport system permease protein
MTAGTAALAARFLRSRRGRARPWALVSGLVILGSVAAIAVVGPFLLGDPLELDMQARLQPLFSPGHLLGTDAFGRDVLTRIVSGARIDLAIGIGATAVTLATGSVIGLLVGLKGGWLDVVVMRIVDLIFAFPFMILVIAIVAMLGPGIGNMFIAIWIGNWIAYTRLVRGHVLSAKTQEYVLAARGLGYGDLRIGVRHILPNIYQYVLLYGMADVVSNILLGGALGYLGLGAKPPSPEWGAMIADAQTYMLSAWWVPAMPAMAIVVVGIAFSLIADGLADRFNLARS